MEENQEPQNQALVNEQAKTKRFLNETGIYIAIVSIIILLATGIGAWYSSLSPGKKRYIFKNYGILGNANTDGLGIIVGLTIYALILSTIAALPAINTQLGFSRAVLSAFFAIAGVSFMFFMIPLLEPLALLSPIATACIMCSVFLAKPAVKKWE